MPKQLCFDKRSVGMTSKKPSARLIWLLLGLAAVQGRRQRHIGDRTAGRGGPGFVSISFEGKFYCVPKTARKQPNAFSACWRNCWLPRRRVVISTDTGSAGGAITSHPI